LFEPNLVVMNLSNNDAVKKFDRRLVSLLKQNEKLGALSLFVLEGNSIEHTGEKMPLKHDMMARVAEKFDIPLLDLHGRLSDADIYDTGFLWWDRAHMTSYGQSIAAEFIAQGALNNFEFLNGPPDALVRRRVAD
jgi:lysophospholipase L1-like esterase